MYMSLWWIAIPVLVPEKVLQSLDVMLSYNITVSLGSDIAADCCRCSDDKMKLNGDGAEEERMRERQLTSMESLKRDALHITDCVVCKGTQLLQRGGVDGVALNRASEEQSRAEDSR